MKILIIGGSGKLGKMLCERLGHHDITTLSRRKENPFYAKHISGDVLTFNSYEGYELVINCAAMKDVAACESEVEQCVSINFQGTLSSLQGAIKGGVKRYVFISTDMASTANSAYGASKMLADTLVVNAAREGKIQTCVVRLGNIIAREGSIFSIFSQKSKELGYVPITDKRMTRFLMSDEQCADFVCGAIMRERLSGEIFAPRCKAYRIGDIATAVAPEFEQKIVGLRSGDALSVTMVAQRETPRTQIQGNSYIIHPQFSGLTFSELEQEVSSDNNYTYATIEELRELYNSLQK